MSLPTPQAPEELTGRPAIKRDFNNLDSLIAELSQPKEEIKRAAPVPGQSASDQQPAELTDGQPTETMAPEIAALSGKMIAGTLDTVLSTGFGLYAKSHNTEKYEASPSQIEKLSAAWAAIASKYNYRVEDSAWFHIIALNLGIYIPKFNDAKLDRLEAVFNEKLAELQRQVKENETRLNIMEDGKGK